MDTGDNPGMHTMSKEAQLQYVGVVRRRYATLKDRAQKGAVLDEVSRPPDIQRPSGTGLRQGLRFPKKRFSA